MTRKQTAVILCEDLQASCLLYRYLRHERGYARVRVLPLPAGCGSQYVRERFPAEVKIQRRSSVAQVLVVHTDADNLTVQQRQQELAQSLQQSGEKSREVSEQIALVIPRWETETWLHHFRGRPGVMETECYPKFRHEEADAAAPAVTALVMLVDGKQTPPENLPSVGVAVVELKRIE